MPLNLSPKTVEEALESLNSPKNLTRGEQRSLLESLYQAAYEAGHTKAAEFAQAIMKDYNESINHPGTDGLTKTERKALRGEYEDPTVTIRRRIEKGHK